MLASMHRCGSRTLTWRHSRSCRAARRRFSGRADVTDLTDVVRDPPDRNLIRCFSIVAHVDHGKSTLADRMLEMLGNIDAIKSGQEVHSQVLDTLQVERERGITVKAQHASMLYRSHLLQLIDTPGHVDFFHETARSVLACDAAILAVDAAQGLQAQTLAACSMATSSGLDIIPVLTKCDLPNAHPSDVREQLFNSLDIDPDMCILASAKTGLGITDILDAIVERCRPPKPVSESQHSRALVIDSWYNVHQGTICLVKVDSGELRPGQRIVLFHAKDSYVISEVGVLSPSAIKTGVLRGGQVGYVIAGIKSLRSVKLGDTVVVVSEDGKNEKEVEIPSTVTALPGFASPKCMVFGSIFPINSEELPLLQDSIDKLTMSDISVSVQRENSQALGTGFRCGFLGVLHMEVFHQRLEQEYNCSIISTAPTVPYKILLKSGEEILVRSPAEFPDPTQIESCSEPFIRASIICPDTYLGRLEELCKSRRGVHDSLTFIDDHKVLLAYRLPLAETIGDFCSQIKSLSAGFASFDYSESGYDPANVVKLDMNLNGKSVDAFSVVCEYGSSLSIGRGIAKRMKENLERQAYEVVIQASVGNKILARERIPPYRKDVLTKGGKTVGGGDITRKKKLLEKQKRGKKRMKRVGSVDVSPDAFRTILQN